MIARKEYIIDGTATHQQYYGQFVTEGVKRVVNSFIGKTNIINSTGVYFNDIPLRKWDALQLPQDVLRLVSKANYPDKPDGGYTLSDVVCIAKEAARQIKEEQEELR